MRLLIEVWFNPRCYQETDPQRDPKLSPLFELARMLMCLDYIASLIVNANRSICGQKKLPEDFAVSESWSDDRESFDHALQSLLSRSVGISLF